MLPVLRATRYDRRLTAGKTKPALIAAADSSGREIGVVVKFGHLMERGEVGLVAEAIASMFARDLGLNVPAPYLVRISEEFVSSIPDVTIAPDFQRAMPVTFGCEQLDGLAPIASAAEIPAHQLFMAGDVFAFDAILDNSDRRPDNPNCYWRENDLVLIDHELTFFFGTLFYKHPWINGALEYCKSGTPHVFYHQLRGKGLDFARLQRALAAITAGRCDEYVAALAPEWRAEFEADIKKMTDFIRVLIENVPATITEIRRVLQ
jgi:hypothetical protein